MLRLSTILMLVLLSIANGAPSVSPRLLDNPGYSSTYRPPQKSDHDQIKSLKQTLTRHTIFAEFQPYLDIVHGCVPFPAIDAIGHINEGLEASGSPSSGCDKSVGQTYTRVGAHNELIAVMYAWYFPKEQASYFDLRGHRHSWHNAILWFKNIYDTRPTIISVEKGGEYTANMMWVQEESHPWLVKDYDEVSCPVSKLIGPVPTLQPLIEWDQMSKVNIAELDIHRFDRDVLLYTYSTYCPFNTKNFPINLEKAYQEIQRSVQTSTQDSFS